MEISQITLLKLMIHSFLLGGAVGVLYDANRVLRVIFGVRYTKKAYSRLYSLKRPISKKAVSIGVSKGFWQSAVINVGDFFCVLAAAVGAILLSYGYNSGRIRFFALGALAAGFFIYRFSIGKAVILVCEPIAFILKYLLLSICDLFALPVRKLYELMRKFLKKITSLYIFTLEKRKKKLYNIREEVFSDKDAEKAASDGSSQSRWRYKKGGGINGKQ